MAVVHVPVLVERLMELLQPRPGGIYVDGTLGNAGHAKVLLERMSPGGILVGIDRDDEILEIAAENLKNFGERAQIRKGLFSRIGNILEEEGIERGNISGIYLDLGLSSLQLDRSYRGFSFNKEGPLDMRMGPKEGLSALEKIRESNVEELTRVIREFGEERYAAKIAGRIREKIVKKELNTTLDLAKIVSDIYPARGRHQRIHPATRTFQALRIWVNEEIEELRLFLKEAPHWLGMGGRLCVISYHSLEDRIVKHFFRNFAKEHEGYRVLTKKPIRASDQEKMENPRSRSAKLRGLVRVH